MEESPAADPGPAADTLTFVGTATTVLRLGSFILLTDPNFLHRGQRLPRQGPLVATTDRTPARCCRPSWDRSSSTGSAERPVDRARAAALPTTIRPVQRGETISLDRPEPPQSP
jgi:hypothetical protein